MCIARRAVKAKLSTQWCASGYVRNPVLSEVVDTLQVSVRGAASDRPHNFLSFGDTIMSTETTTAVVESAPAVEIKNRRCKVKSHEIVEVILPNGVSFTVSGVDCSVAPTTKPETKPSETEAKQAEGPAPRKGGFGRKPKETKPEAAAPAAPVDTAPAAPEAANSKAKEAARKNAGQSTWVNSVHTDEEFKGLATFITKKGPRDVAILGKGEKKYKIGWLLETKKEQAYCWKKSVFFVALNDTRLIDIELF